MPGEPGTSRPVRWEFVRARRGELILGAVALSGIGGLVAGTAKRSGPFGSCNVALSVPIPTSRPKGNGEDHGR